MRTLLIFVLTLSPIYAANAQETLPEPNWSLALARESAMQVDTQAALKPLFQLARQGQNAVLLQELKKIEMHTDWPVPAREHVLQAFAAGLGDLQPGSVDSEVLDYLRNYQPQTIVPGSDHALAGVPLYNVRSATAGSVNEWRRQSAFTRALALFSQTGQGWLDAYLEAGPQQRKGFEDALEAADKKQLAELASVAMQRAHQDPALASLAARAGLVLSDPVLFQQAISSSDGPAVGSLLRQAATVFSDREIFDLLEFSVEQAPAVTGALAIALLTPTRLEQAEFNELLLKALDDQQLAPAAALALSRSKDPAIAQRLPQESFPGLQAEVPRISEWVENAPVSDDTKIALGYPVPIPVETPLPFAGFRSYAGLHARHQDLSMTTPWVHPRQIGATRNGRTIWAYQLGDADQLTIDGLREHAMISNGGIHAREWQSPEVATGIMELLALSEDDQHLVSYLRDNANIIVIPVLNIDGFLQTQKYPSLNWMGTDPSDPEYSPRDGRMRRKNMLGADDDLMTRDDHLQGVDLNRNNPPYWANNPQRSSYDPESIVHHGASAHSEPETQALVAATLLGPVDKLSMFTDLHSFSQVHFWVRNGNPRLGRLTENLLQVFTDHHSSFPAGKFYAFSSMANTPVNQGIGLAEEYFTHTYQVPSWTLEIEPSGGSHPGLPGQGADYGGLGRNGHDGFILPESEVERVRTELAQTFAVAYYRQAGPPALRSYRLVDKASNAVVFEADWDTVNQHNRLLHSFQAHPVQLGREYSAWVAWDKPMRWRIDGAVDKLPGQPFSTLQVNRAHYVDGATLNATMGDISWLNEAGSAPGGFMRYRDDALVFDLAFSQNDTNNNLVQGTATANLEISARDMTGSLSDANPATVARWESGGWSGYENSAGDDLTDTGGKDSTIQFLVTSDDAGTPFVVEPGTSAAWFDPERNGEGFMLEILSPEAAIMYWFTYDTEGEQDWYIAEGEILGNRIVFTELAQVSGGEFGPGFDPDKVVRTVVGSASFIWSSCNSGAMSWVIDKPGSPPRQGRMNLLRLSQVMGVSCGPPMGAPVRPESRLSGSWYDPSHSGEGYVLEVLSNQQALVYWFSYDADGRRRWFFGSGALVDDKLQFAELLTTSGGRFGAAFDPADITVSPWGALQLQLDCDGGPATFEPTETGFPAGSLDLVRLTILDGLSCDN